MKVVISRRKLSRGLKASHASSTTARQHAAYEALVCIKAFIFSRFSSVASNLVVLLLDFILNCRFQRTTYMASCTSLGIGDLSGMTIAFIPSMLNTNYITSLIVILSSCYSPFHQQRSDTVIALKQIFMFRLQRNQRIVYRPVH